VTREFHGSSSGTGNVEPVKVWNWFGTGTAKIKKAVPELELEPPKFWNFRITASNRSDKFNDWDHFPSPYLTTFLNSFLSIPIKLQKSFFIRLERGAVSMIPSPYISYPLSTPKEINCNSLVK